MKGTNMKHILFLLLFLATTAAAQTGLHSAVALGENVKDTTWTLWKAGTNQDSVNVQSRVRLGMLRFTLINPTTDTLKVAFCQSWADTTKFIRIDPTQDVWNYSAKDATWVKFIAFSASDTLLGRIIKFY